MIVDALIISFNTREVLRQTLSTLTAHPPGPGIALRIRVFDNGSSDGSAEMIATDFPEVDLMRSEQNAGFGTANNILFASSDAEFVLLLNSDVIVTEDVVGPLIEALIADPSVIAASPRLVHVGGEVQYSAQRFPSLSYEIAMVIRGKRVGRAITHWFDSDRRTREVLEVELTGRRVTRHADSIWATCWMLRRSDIRSGQLFDPDFRMYDEDLDFCRRAQEDGRALLYLADVELTHLGGASSVSNAAKLRLMARARCRYYARHHGPATAFLYAAFIPVLFNVTMWAERVPRRGWRAFRSNT